MKIHTILFATDFSPCSRYALDVAFALARNLGARLLILHVASPSPFVTYGEFEKVLDRSAGYRHELEEKLRQCERPGCHAEFVLKDGDPAREIIQLAQDASCGLIVVGTHGRTGLDRLLTGSVAEKVLREASCPVLTVKTPSVSTATP
jgi:nucleotide-binding universal stress UspA family protein